MVFFLLDDTRKLLLSSESARELIKLFPSQLRFVDDRFMPMEWSEDDRWWKAACARGFIELSEDGKSGLMAPARLHLTPISSDMELARGWARPLTLMFGNAAISDARVSILLQRLYGLTPAETEICLSLCGTGLSPKECAALRGVSVSTIRTQIAAIHAKVGARRHQDLVRVFNDLCERSPLL